MFSQRDKLYLGQFAALVSFGCIAWPSEKFGRVLMFQMVLVSPLGIYDFRTAMHCALLFSGPVLTLINLIWLKKSELKSVRMARVGVLLMLAEVVNYHILTWQQGNPKQRLIFIPEIVFLLLAIVIWIVSARRLERK